MSAKNVDKHNRFRSITVGFRVSPEENEELNRAVARDFPNRNIAIASVWGARSWYSQIPGFTRRSKTKWQQFLWNWNELQQEIVLLKNCFVPLASLLLP